jgi:serine/threonine-protein kinase
MMVAAALIVAGVAAVALVRGGIFRPFVLGANDHLLLTVIENKTGDKTLDGTVMQGLEIALHQSRTLNLFGGAAYGAGLRQVAAEGGASAGMVPEQRVAQQVGAKAYLYGEIRGSTAPYTISVDVLKSNSNDKVETLEEEAGSRAEIAAAIGRLAQDIRVEVSEDKKAEERSTIPFELDATANLNALHAYALGEVAMRNGRTKDAIVAYQQAVVFDPKFAQAQMRLAWLYRSEKAEVGAANAAEMAQKAAAKASGKVKLLAQFCYEMNVSGNLEQAATTIRQYVARYPHDGVGMKGLARVLRMQGDLQRALAAAQNGFEVNPFDTEVYTEAELAMIGMDHYDSALQLEMQAEHIGVASSGTKLTAAYLAGKEDVTLAQANAMQAALAGMTTTNGTPITYAELYRYGLYLDNAGKIGAGSELWRVSAGVASSVPGLDSTQASMLAQGALDRALMESCTAALEMVGEVKELPKGPVASFNAGMAAALCGDQMFAYKTMATLQKNYPQNTSVTQYFVPQLQAAIEVGANEPAKALDSLIALEEYDQVSLTPYLRGMANAALGQMPAAILDFQVVLDHRGTNFTLGSNAYPMAEAGMARAYAANHDKTSSVEAYRRLVTLWGGADQDQPLLKEALTKTGGDSSSHH